MELSTANARMVVRATWGVSVSPPMPRFEEYLARLGPSTGRENGADTEVRRALRERALELRDSHRPPLHLPWCPTRAIATQRLFAAIVSFVDEYHGPYPEEFFPRAAMSALIDAFAVRPPMSLDVVDQLEASLSVVGPHPFAAAVALHGALRTLARGRDRRLGAPFDLSLEQRLAKGASIAPFARALGPRRDALGDTYHYWACFAAGLHCGIRTRDPARLAMLALFGVGADLMAAVRHGIFGHELFAGKHDAVDRAGLSHGLEIGRLLEPGPTRRHRSRGSRTTCARSGRATSRTTARGWRGSRSAPALCD